MLVQVSQIKRLTCAGLEPAYVGGALVDCRPAACSGRTAESPASALRLDAATRGESRCGRVCVCPPARRTASSCSNTDASGIDVAFIAVTLSCQSGMSPCGLR